MSESKSNEMNRRDFLKRSLQVTGALAGTAVVMACGGGGAAKAEAKVAPFPLLPESDPMAMALGYVKDINTADKTKYPQWKAGNTCDKCMHWIEVKNADGTVNPDYGRCNLIAKTKEENGPVITANGWCSVFAPKPA